MSVGQLLRLGVGGANLPYSTRVLGYSPIAYWILGEASGGVAACQVDSDQNGAYTGVTLGQTGIGDGHTCPLFDGAEDFVNIYSAALNTAFDGQEGSFMMWLRVFNAGVWTDGAHRMPYSIGVSDTHEVYIHKSNAANTVYTRYRAGGTLESYTLVISSTGWINLIQTWSLSDDEYKIYQGGTLMGTETSLGTWAGALDSARVVLGAFNTGLDYPWHGYLAHCAVFDKVLLPTQAAHLAVV